MLEQPVNNKGCSSIQFLLSFSISWKKRNFLRVVFFHYLSSESYFLTYKRLFRALVSWSIRKLRFLKYKKSLFLRKYKKLFTGECFYLLSLEIPFLKNKKYEPRNLYFHKYKKLLNLEARKFHYQRYKKNFSVEARKVHFLKYKKFFLKCAR